MHVQQTLRQVVDERTRTSILSEEGLLPTRSLLLTGPPGVGKSLAAKWIAHELDLPLVTLDLSAVMSSFLGKTGTNVRHVLDYAKNMPCVLLLDELDSVAKRRDDATEIGELKRLVTVLLQEIDDWPSTGILIAATNHPDLLDPAVWRRFEIIIDFPMPELGQIHQFIERILEDRVPDKKLISVVAHSLLGLSYSEIERDLLRTLKRAVMYRVSFPFALQELVKSRVDGLSAKGRKEIAAMLRGAGHSQRDTSRWTGLHRNTIKKLEN
jgi:SpoVK/Ycf46/Vps4 family AAA+-type ATPase